MVLALSLSILLELVWQLIIVLTTRYKVVLLNLLFSHHRYWLALIWRKLVSLFAVVSSNAARAARWQAWVASLRQNLLGHSLSADDWWRLATSVATARRIDVEGAWPTEAYLILDIVHKMGSLLLWRLLNVVLPSRFAFLWDNCRFLACSFLWFDFILLVLLHQKRLISNKSDLEVLRAFLVIQPADWNSMGNIFLVLTSKHLWLHFNASSSNSSVGSFTSPGVLLIDWWR